MYYQPGALCAPIWSYSYSRVSVCPSVQGLGRPRNELMVVDGMYGCFKLAGLFASSLQMEAK